MRDAGGRRTFLIGLALAATAAAGEPPQDPWIGQRVITLPGAVLRVGDKVVDDQGVAETRAATGRLEAFRRVYRVGRVDGGWLWLLPEERGVPGWVQASQVNLISAAVDYYTAQVAANPSAHNYSLRGDAWFVRKEYEIAIGDYSEAIRIDPRYVTGWNNRGATRLEMGDVDRAIADYGEAIRIEPRYAQGYANRATCWAKKKDYARALADLDEAIRIDPIFASAYSSRGNVRREQKEFAKGLPDYDESIRLDPRHAKTFVNRGYSRRMLRQYAPALADFAEAIRLDPGEAAAYDKQARVWATCPDPALRDGRRAVESATRACRMTDSRDAGYVDTLAAALAESGAFDEAIYQELAALDLPDPKAAELRPGFEARLALYRAKTPAREP